MPLLDIAISQPCSCFRNNIVAFRSQTDLCKKIIAGNDRRLVLASTVSLGNFCIGGKLGENFTSGRARVWRSRLMIKAVGTLEITSAPCKNGDVKRLQNVLMMDDDSAMSKSTDLEPPQSYNDDSSDVEERERLRRMRISKANKGNTPWNKGRKHSPETLRRIKERTRLAMQNPKVKAKLVNLGHAQSKETRLKIGVGVRLGWEKRREKLILQDTCYYEWQNLIAETAQKGLLGEEKLEWDSYKILNKQLEQQWLQSVEERKRTRPKGSKRAPKSAEQRRKISEAIAAKWADPEYRNRVYSGLAKYHGITEGAERKPKRKPPGDGKAQNRSPKNKDENQDLVKRKTKSPNQQTKPRKSRAPQYKDPLASTKLEMLKNIRAQRATVVSRKSEAAITKARFLISEAEKAAKALEIAAKTSPLAHASLMESRMLIAEAHKIIESISTGDAVTYSEDENGNDDLSKSLTEPVPDFADQNLEFIKPTKVNGVPSVPASLEETDRFSFDELCFLDFINGNGSSPYSLETWQQLPQTTPNGHASSVMDDMVNRSDLTKSPSHREPNPNGVSLHKRNSSVNGLKLGTENAKAPKEPANKIKKWVRGRLIEVEEET